MDEKYVSGFGDIHYWYLKYKGICPNCGVDMNKFDPERNIYPHFTGQCAAEKEFKKEEK